MEPPNQSDLKSQQPTSQETFSDHQETNLLGKAELMLKELKQRRAFILKQLDDSGSDYWSGRLADITETISQVRRTFGVGYGNRFDRFD